MPPLATQIAIRLPADLTEALGLVAARNGRTRAQEARFALEWHVTREAVAETRAQGMTDEELDAFILGRRAQADDRPGGDPADVETPPTAQESRAGGP